MSKKNYTFQKEYQENDSILKFIFNGYHQNKNLNKEEYDELLDKVFYRMLIYQDIDKIMTWFQTIFRNFKEDYIELSINRNNKETKVEYKNKKLVYFEIKENLDTMKTLNVIYSTPFNFHTYIENNSLNNKETLEKYEEKLKDVWQLIYKLENVSVVKLQERDKTIWEFYKLFYEENPDFSSEDISVNIQTMLCILIQFNISLDYGFDHTLLNSKMPFSLALQYDLDRLIPLGEVQEIEEPVVQMAERRKKEIQWIGKLVRENTNGDLNKLIQLSTIIYASRYDLSEKTNVEDVSKFIGCTSVDVRESIQLVRKIDQKIEEGKA